MGEREVSSEDNQTMNMIIAIIRPSKLDPVVGLVANLACMLFYLVGPFVVSGMSVKEPYIALGICAVWGIYGGIYFLRSSKKLARPLLLSERPAPLPVSV
jgi:hypothetical protein